MTTALPKAVQRQVEDAENLQRQLYAQPEAESSESPGTEQTESEQAQADVQTAQVPTPETQAPTAPQERTVSKDQDPEYWKSRFMSLQGMYNTQIPQLQNENAQLRHQLQTVAAQLADANKRTQPQEQPASAKVTDKDREAFGQDLIDLQQRIAREVGDQIRAEAQTAIDEKNREIAELRSQMGDVSNHVQATATDQFFKNLTSRVADWETVNAQPEFVQWLSKVDRRSGIRLQAMLDDAASSRDLDRVVSIFEDFKATQAPPPAAAPVQEQRRPADDLQRQVTPSKARATAAPAAQGETWTGAKYAEVYDRRYEKTHGEAEATRMRAEADRAVAEGRVAW